MSKSEIFFIACLFTFGVFLGLNIGLAIAKQYRNNPVYNVDIIQVCPRPFEFLPRPNPNEVPRQS